MERDLGLSHGQGKPPHRGESRAVPREGRAQVRELQMTPELTHRQLLAHHAHCELPGYQHITPESISNPPPASLCTGEALGPPEWQQSPPVPSPAPLLSPRAAPSATPG